MEYLATGGQCVALQPVLLTTTKIKNNNEGNTMKPEAAKQQELNEDDLRSFNEDIKYVYFGRRKASNKHDGVVCVGYKIDKSGTVLRLAAAFCSPEDIFEKSESRKRVNVRINAGAFEDLVKDVAEISEDNPLFSDMKYEEIISLSVAALNSAIPPFWRANYKTFLNNAKPYPKFARIPLPWWLSNVTLASVKQ